MTLALLDLRQAVSDAPAIELPVLSDADRGRAIGTWHGRMVNEHVSARVFAALVAQMMRAGLDPMWQERVAGFITDELRHGRRCAEVVVALGGQAVAEVPALDEVPSHQDVSALEAVIRNIMTVCCLHETVAVALIGAEHEAVGPPALAETLAAILADEVQHARFGWEVLRELGPELDAELRERLGAYLVEAFAHLRTHELAHLPEGPAPSAAAMAVGVCDGRDARSLFYDVVSNVIIPGLEEHGIPAAAAWKASAALD